MRLGESSSDDAPVKDLLPLRLISVHDGFSFRRSSSAVAGVRAWGRGLVKEKGKGGAWQGREKGGEGMGTAASG